MDFFQDKCMSGGAKVSGQVYNELDNCLVDVNLHGYKTRV